MTLTRSSEIKEKCGWCAPLVRERAAPHAARSGHLDVYSIRCGHGSVIYSVVYHFLGSLLPFNSSQYTVKPE
jgi:hypothetical protein